jgi:nucleoside-diphosphate-sugar epimerase
VPGRVYNIGGGSRVTVTHVLAIIERLVGKPLNLRHEGVQKGDMRDTYADTSLARGEIGYKPTVTLEEGLEAELAWIKDAHAAPS